MKKAVALLMILAVTTTTTLFAIPVSATGSVDASSAEATTAGLSIQTDAATELSIQTDITDDADDLFADVQAVALSAEEAQDVEGSGLFGIIIGVALLGAGIGAGAAILGVNLLAPMLP